jgi:shikimate dehydrogenase
VIAWDKRTAALDGAGLVVNTTILGMGGQPPLELDLKALPVDAVVNDIVYSPLETSLLITARARGNPAVDGLGMLLHQARPAFHAFFGVDPAVTPALRAHVLGT